MSRRWRVLLVLLIFSLAPLVAVTILCQRGASRLSMSILSLVDASLTQIVGKELQETAENYARTVSSRIEIPEVYRTVSGTANNIDLLLSRIHQVNDFSSQWLPDITAFIVNSAIEQKAGESALRILATRDFEQKEKTWQAVNEMQWLSSPNIKGMARLASEVRDRRSGYLEMVYQTDESIWAYGGVGENLGLVIILPKEKILSQVQQVHDLLMLLTRRQWLVIGAASGVVIFLVMLTAFWSSHSMTRPLQVMVEAVKRLARGDFSSRMELATGDERDILARAFNEMVPQLEDRLRIRKALEVAQAVQQKFLPREIPALPGFEIAATAVYCDETGGDYFDFFPCGEDGERLGVAIGDVSGHGVPAALLMTTVRALLRMRSSQPGSMAEVVNSVNRHLTADTYEEGLFTTLLYLNIDQAKQKLRWVRAGHDPGILYNPATDDFEEIQGRGIALGVDKDWHYTESERGELTTNQIIFLGTDGIWEAINANGEMFGKQRLYEIIRRNAHSTAADIQTGVLEALGNFRGKCNQEDDVTMVVIKVK
jgi:sigma-B regulation protein RsbU (phosphoserine phosphatase)